jgi:hypothetical protein
MVDGVETTQYHLMKSTKQRQAKTISRTQEQRSRIPDDPTEIAQIFVEYLKDKYSSIVVSDSCVAEILNVIRPNTQPFYAAYLEQPIMAEERYVTLKSGGSNKAPGSDGISRELNIQMWDIIREDMLVFMNQMYIHNSDASPTAWHYRQLAQGERRYNTGGISFDNADEYGLQTICQNNRATSDPSVGRGANIELILLRTGQIYT